MQIESAAKMSFEALYDASMDAFSDYVVPAAMTEDQWRDMLTIRGYVPELSFVATEAGDVKAYWMTGTAPKDRPGVGYAISVGTRPSARRRGLSQQLFAQVSDALRHQGFTGMMHEVIVSNTPAVKLYEGLGYRPARRVKCFRGDVRADLQGNANITMRECAIDEAEKLAAQIGGWRPTWQNDFHAMRQGDERVLAFIATLDGTDVGFGVLVPDYKQLTQLGVLAAARRKGVATAMIAHWRDHYELTTMSMLNVPDTDKAMIALFGAMGWQNTIDQYQMELTL